MCNHAYTLPQGPVHFCLQCKQIVKVEEITRGGKVYQDVVMPPRVFELTAKRWIFSSPWAQIPFSVAQKYGWYISVIGRDEYLIMPICRHGVPKLYSARRLTNNGGMKYLYPKDVQKLPWLSNDILGDVVVLCEGVADGAFVSQIYSSVALLGNYLPDVLKESLVGKKRILVALDGDVVGITSAVRIARSLQNAVPVIFPNGLEPTDYTLADLKGVLDGYL